jgi:hypothetical protein
LGTNLFQSAPAVPPSVPIEPVSTFNRNNARATCHPPRFAMDAARQL